jgi:hypothetical protein
LRVPVRNPALIGLDLPLTALISIAGRRRKILTYTQINKNNKRKSLSDDRHTLFTLEESVPPQMTYTCESQYITQPSSV